MQIYNAVKACAMAVLYVTYIMSQRRVYKYSEAYYIIVPCAYVRYVYFGMKINCKSGYVTYIMSQRRVYKYSEAYYIIVPCAYVRYVYFGMKINCKSGVQWLSGRVLDLRRTARGFKVSKVAKIRNRYNQVPHLTQDTNGKVTNSQKTPQTRAKRSALSQQVTTKHI